MMHGKNSDLNITKAKKYYVDIQKDDSLKDRFHKAIKILATNTGPLNKRIFNCYWDYLYPINSDNFKEIDLKEKLNFIEKILSNKSKCTYYKHFQGGNLHCHWKESKQIAENIFYIYDAIMEIKE